MSKTSWRLCHLLWDDCTLITIRAISLNGATLNAQWCYPVATPCGGFIHRCWHHGERPTVKLRYGPTGRTDRPVTVWKPCIAHGCEGVGEHSKWNPGCPSRNLTAGFYLSIGFLSPINLYSLIIKCLFLDLLSRVVSWSRAGCKTCSTWTCSIMCSCISACFCFLLTIPSAKNKGSTRTDSQTDTGRTQRPTVKPPHTTVDTVQHHDMEPPNWGSNLQSSSLATTFAKPHFSTCPWGNFTSNRSKSRRMKADFPALAAPTTKLRGVVRSGVLWGGGRCGRANG